jgi:hypothetical protein
MEEIALAVLPRSMDSEASSEAASDSDSEINSTAPSPSQIQLPKISQSAQAELPVHLCLTCDRQYAGDDGYCSKSCRMQRQIKFSYHPERSTGRLAAQKHQDEIESGLEPHEIQDAPSDVGDRIPYFTPTVLRVEGEGQFPPDKYHKCLRCDTTEFESYFNLRSHLSITHGEETAYDCWACEAKYVRFVDLKLHIKGRHKDDIEGTISKIQGHHGIDAISARFRAFKSSHLFNIAAEYCASYAKAEYTDEGLRENIIERFGKWDRDQIEGSKGPPTVPNSPFEHPYSRSQYEPRLETQLLDDTGEGIVVPTSQNRKQGRLRDYPCTHDDCDRVFVSSSART